MRQYEKHLMVLSRGYFEAKSAVISNSSGIIRSIMSGIEQRGGQPQEEEQRITRRPFLRGILLAGVGVASAVGGLTDATIGALQAINIREKFPRKVAEQKLAQEGHSKARTLTDAGLAVGGVVMAHMGALDLKDAWKSGAVQAPVQNEQPQPPTEK